MTKEEYMQELGKSIVNSRMDYNSGCMPVVMYGFMIAAFVVCFMCSCKSVSSTEETIDYRHMARITERMDSMIHATSTWQKSLYEKQTSLVDSFKQKEVRDTSHVIFLGAKGDTVKEKIIIREYIESQHSSSESTQELKEEFFKQTDSLLQVNRQMETKMDSLLQSHNKETVVEKKPSLGDKLKWFAGGIVLTIIGGIACMTAFIKKNS